MKTIDEDIKKNEFRKCYLFFGEEDYLKKQYKEKLLAALIDRKDNMNFTTFQGKNSSANSMIDLSETMPFLSERRVILVEDSGFFKSSNDELAQYLGSVPDTSCLLFVETEIDKRTKTYKAVRNHGAVVEFARQDETILIKWILSKIKREKKNISEAAIQLFLSRTGSDMSNIDRELEKLFCYTLNKDVIGLSDVAEITTERIQNKIFDMVDALAVHNKNLALNLYYDLLSLKEPPMRILFLITRQFRLLALVKEMGLQQRSNAKAAKAAGVPEFAIRKLQIQAKNYSKTEILQILSDSIDVEEAVKTGKLDEKMAVEILLIKYGKS
ncbi:MAG: DNA polymerase III subunit delta [Lachnospiraceae bacterium]